MLFRSLIYFVCLSLLSFSIARAEKADRDKPVHYRADSQIGKLGEINETTLLDNVIITQGSMTIRANKIILRQLPDDSYTIAAFGNPMNFRQKRDGVDEYIEAYAERATFNSKSEILELYNNAKIIRGQDELKSDYISYHAGLERFEAKGQSTTGKSSGVRGVFQPKAKSKPAEPLPLKPSGTLDDPPKQ